MQMRLQRAEGSEPCGLFCTLIRWHRIVYAVLLIGMTLFPWGISSSPTAFAQGGSVNLLQNPGFETGNLSPWARWTLKRVVIYTVGHGMLAFSLRGKRW